MEASFIAHKMGNNELAVEIGEMLVESGKYPEDKAKAIKENVVWYKKALVGSSVSEEVSEPTPVPKSVPKSVPKPVDYHKFRDFDVNPYRHQSIVIDDFFADPDAVRQFALSQEYTNKGNFPGFRTKEFLDDSQKELFEKIMGRKITFWAGGFNGSFQYTTTDMKSWIHRDMTDCSAIIYLTPDAPKNAGTKFYRHKESGKTYGRGEDNVYLDKFAYNEDEWEVIEEVLNVYNRCVIFDGRRSHKSAEYFGEDINDGRLFMCFFFNVEK